MPRHEESRVLPHPVPAVFSVVADVERYPEFLPWCLASRVYDRADDTFTADLVIGYKVLRESYTSRVHTVPQQSVRIEYLSGPFKYLENTWGFTATHEGGCRVDFFIDFDVLRRLMHHLASGLLTEVV
ncbi:MAG: type II toxin-antitoxin system RatA family toxin, partial [Holosporales bacterium]